MGGIETGADALAFLALGASAVAVGTASFRDPAAAARIRSELAAELAARGLDRLPRVEARLRPRLEVEPNFGENAPNPFAAERQRGYTRRRPMAPSSVDTASAAVPARTHEQRMRALRRANEIRSARAKLKRDLKAGKAQIEKLLLDPPDYVLSAKAFDMILAVPEVRPGEGEQDPHPVPDLALEDDRRPLRAPARRARPVPAPLAGPPPPAVIGWPRGRQGLRDHRALRGRQGDADPRCCASGSPGLELSTSATTRAPREGEEDGRDYHFLDRRGVRPPRGRATSSSSTLPTAATATGPCARRSSAGSRRASRWCSRSRSRARARCAPRCPRRCWCSSPRPTRRRCASGSRAAAPTIAEAIAERLRTAEIELDAQQEFQHVVVQRRARARRRRSWSEIVRAELARLSGRRRDPYTRPR